jgi:hypothetical protein
MRNRQATTATPKGDFEATNRYPKAMVVTIK